MPVDPNKSAISAPVIPPSRLGSQLLQHDAIEIPRGREAGSKLASQGQYPFLSEDPMVYSPSFRAIQANKYTENFQGSKFASRDSDDGIEFVYYEDGSILICNDERGEYHFFTEAGQKHKAHLLRVTSRLFDDVSLLDSKEKLGHGKFSQVHKLSIPGQDTSLAVKTTKKDMFRARESNEAISALQLESGNENSLMSRSSKVLIHRMALRDTVKMIGVLKDCETSQPEFYGFSIRTSPADSNGIQEIQYHEPVEASSMADLLERIEAQLKREKEFNLDGLKNEAVLCQILTTNFHGDVDNFMSALVNQYYQFVAEVSGKTSMDRRVNGEIGDIAINDEGGTSNVLVTGYDDQSKQFEFMIIDPTEIQSLIPKRKSSSKPNNILLNDELSGANQFIYSKIDKSSLTTINNSLWMLK